MDNRRESHWINSSITFQTKFFKLQKHALLNFWPLNLNYAIIEKRVNFVCQIQLDLIYIFSLNWIMRPIVGTNYCSLLPFNFTCMVSEQCLIICWGGLTLVAFTVTTSVCVCVFGNGSWETSSIVQLSIFSIVYLFRHKL